MPEKPRVEETEQMSTPGESIPIHLLCTRLLPALGQSAHHEAKSGTPPVKPIGFADANHHRQDPGDPPDPDGQRY